MIRIINNKKTSTKGFAHIYPFKSNFLNINGHKLHYLDEGKGKPIIMIHGNPTWSFYFRNLVKKLSKKYRTIVPDHIGCGFSDKPDIKKYNYTLENRVNDFNFLIKNLNIKEKITLILHDWGGMIGLCWALKNINKIEKIIITNTSGFLLPKNKKLPLRLWILKYLNFLAVPLVLGFNIFSRAALFMACKTRLSKDIKKGLTVPYNSWKNRIATLMFVKDIPLTKKDKSYNLVKQVDENLFKLKKIPLMILWGKKDFVFDMNFLNEWKKRFPNAKIHLFKNAGHYVFEDKHQEACTLIKNFIEK